MRNTSISLRTLLLLCVCVPNTALLHGQEQRSNTSGFTIGASLLGSSVSTDFDNVSVVENGHGFHIELGWGFTPHVTAFLSSYGSVIEGEDGYTLGQGDLGVRYLFRDIDKRARPYLEGAFTVRQIRSDYGVGFETVTIKANSPSATLGGGVQVFFSPKVALDIGATYTPGSFSDWTANGAAIEFQDVDANSAQVRLGIRFWPMKK